MHDPQKDTPHLWNDVRDTTHHTRTNIGFKEKRDWKSAKAVFDEHTLTISGHPVMEDWETPYMEALAKIATSNGGVVLELGYGMGISSQYIQKAKIEKHYIVEANHDVAERASIFAKSAPHTTHVLEGFWEEVIDQIPDEHIDGILFDTYPLSEREIHKNHFEFFPTAYRKLKKGGVFTYYSDEICDYSSDHIQKLIEAGFRRENIQKSVVSVIPSPKCLYWKASTIVAPIILK